MQTLRFLPMVITFMALGLSAAQGAAPVQGDQQWTRQEASGLQHFVLLHEESSGWVAESFGRAPGKLQEVEWRRSFSQHEEALAFLKPALQGFARYAQPNTELSLPTESVTEVKGAVLWKATQKWSWDWELKYSQWVIDNVDSNFFVLHQIQTDCADVAFALKWIFARINGLPMGNKLAGSNDLVTHETMKQSWASLPTDADWSRDQRFLAALDYVLSNTYTGSLLGDSYPVRIAPETIIPGVHHLNVAPGHHHTRFLRLISIDPGQPLVLIFSDDPRIVRVLYQSGFWDYTQLKEGEGGFLRIRWLEKAGSAWKLRAGKDMPDFSKEEFDPAFMGQHSDFASAVLDRLVVNLDYTQRQSEGITYIKDQITRRQKTVEEGFLACQKESCVSGTSGYENWSTPARDARMEETFSQLENLVYYNQSQHPELKTQWDAALLGNVITLDGSNYFTLGHVRDVWSAGGFSSDPSQPVLVRWGL